MHASVIKEIWKISTYNCDGHYVFQFLYVAPVPYIEGPTSMHIPNTTPHLNPLVGLCIFSQNLMATDNEVNNF